MYRDPSGNVQLTSWKPTKIGEHVGTEHLGDLTVKSGSKVDTIKINVLESGVYKLNNAGVPVERLNDKQSKMVLDYIISKNSSKHVTEKLAKIGIEKSDNISSYLSKSNKVFGKEVPQGKWGKVKAGGKLLGAVGAILSAIPTESLNATTPLDQKTKDLGLEQWDTGLRDPVTKITVHPERPEEILKWRREFLEIEKTFPDSD